MQTNSPKICPDSTKPHATLLILSSSATPQRTTRRRHSERDSEDSIVLTPIYRHGRPGHGPGVRASPRAPPQGSHRRGCRHPGDRPLPSRLRRPGRRGGPGGRSGQGKPGVGVLRGGAPRRARRYDGAGAGGPEGVLRDAGGGEGRRAEGQGGAARVLRVGAHQERQGLEGGVRLRPTRAAAARRRVRRRARVPEQVAPGPARIQRGAGGVRQGDGGAGTEAAGADRAEPGAETGQTARFLQGRPDNIHPAEPLPALPEPRARPRCHPPQGRRRAHHTLSGQRRRARRPAPVRRRVGAGQAHPGLLHHQRRRHHPGVEQRHVRERGAPGVGEFAQGEVLLAILFQPPQRCYDRAAGGAGERRQPAQVRALQLGRVLQNQEEQQLQEARRGERPDRTF